MTNLKSHPCEVLKRIAWVLLIAACIDLAGAGCVAHGLAASMHAVSMDFENVFGGSR